MIRYKLIVNTLTEGFNGGDLVGISTSTYDKDEVTIVRRGEHELHSKEDEE